VRFRQRTDQEYQLEVFTSEDGLHGNVFIDGASYKTGDGRIFVGGYYGFNVFSPDQLFSNSFLPPVVVTGIWVSNEKVNEYDALANGLVLKYNQNNITLEFSALSYKTVLLQELYLDLEGILKDL